MTEPKTVAVLGATSDPQKFAYRAWQKLKAAGHKVLLINPNFTAIEGQPVLASLDQIHEPVDTLTLYVGPEKSEALMEDILDLRPQRVIFNPGTESATLAAALRDHRIHSVRGCTLVMLDSGTF